MGVSCHKSVISALQQRQEDQKFKVIFSYIVKLRPVWVLCVCVCVCVCVFVSVFMCERERDRENIRHLYEMLKIYKNPYRKTLCPNTARWGLGIGERGCVALGLQHTTCFERT